MDAVLQQFEQAVGDEFAEWLTRTAGHACTFVRRAGEAPDLVYSYRSEELFVEVTGAYYDGAHAAFLWKAARGQSDAPDHWEGVEPDKSLAAAVIARVNQKSLKRYGPNTNGTYLGSAQPETCHPGLDPGSMPRRRSAASTPTWIPGQAPMALG